MILSNVDKEALIKILKDAAFALESVAHLQGQEKTLLPYAAKCRAAVRDLTWKGKKKC